MTELNNYWFKKLQNQNRDKFRENFEKIKVNFRKNLNNNFEKLEGNLKKIKNFKQIKVKIKVKYRKILDKI